VVTSTRKRSQGTSHRKAPALRSVSRALRLLRGLDHSTSGRGLGDLSSALGLHKTTALRLLRTLVAAGIIVHEESTGRYLHNPAFWVGLAPFLRPALSLTSDTDTLLKRLAQSAEATVVIGLVDETGRNVVDLMRAVPSSPVYVEHSDFEHRSLHATSAGKCYLAAASYDEVAEYARGGLARVTGQTIVSIRRLREELALVRQQGYALNLGEAVAGEFYMGVPLRGPDGLVIGGVVRALPDRHLTDDALREYLAPLRETSEGISDLIGDAAWLARLKEGAPHPAVPSSGLDAADIGSGNASTPMVRSVARAVRVFVLLLRSREGESSTEVARRCGLNGATVFRLLRTLAAEGFVRRDPASGRYLVSPLFWIRLAPVLRSATLLTRWSASILDSLAQATGATACLVFPDSEERRVVVYQHALPRRPLCWHPENLPPPPLHSAATGKCYLAAQSSLGLRAYIAKGLEALTENTITSPERLLRELLAVRRRGFALAREETTLGAAALAVPVTDERGRVVASLATVPLVQELTEANIRRWLPLLRRGAQRLSCMFVADWRERLPLVGPLERAASSSYATE